MVAISALPSSPISWITAASAVAAPRRRADRAQDGNLASEHGAVSVKLFKR